MSKHDNNPFSPKERDFIRGLAEKGKSVEQIRDRLVEKFSVTRKIKVVEDELQRIGYLAGGRSTKEGLPVAASNGAPDAGATFKQVSSRSIDPDKLFAPMERDFIKERIAKGDDAQEILKRLIKKYGQTRSIDDVERMIARIKSDVAIKVETVTKPSVVDKFEQGKIYVYAGIGAMLCVRVKALKDSDSDRVMVRLKQVYGGDVPVVKDTPVTSSFKKNTRELVTPPVMDKIVAMLERGTSDTALPAKSKHFKGFYEDRVGSIALTEVADILCLIRKRSVIDGGLTGVDTEYARKAMAIIASEHSLVMGVDYRQSLRLIGEKAGFEKIFAAPSHGAGAHPASL